MTSSIEVRLSQKEDCLDLPLPKYQSDGSSGVDLYAANLDPIEISPQQILKIPTGLFLEIPKGFEAQIRPRSGLALKHGISMVNTPGTIDSDYRGEISVILINLGQKVFLINRGDRIAQMVFAPIVKASWRRVDQLQETNRGSGGFGSTGL